MIMFGGMRELEELIKKQGPILDRIDMQRVHHLINPPLRLRSVCRFCGNSMSLEIATLSLQPGADVRAPIALRGVDDLYAHQRCVDREQGRRHV